MKTNNQKSGISVSERRLNNRERQARWRANNLEKARAQGRKKSHLFALRHPQRIKLSRRCVNMKKKIARLQLELAAQKIACSEFEQTSPATNGKQILFDFDNVSNRSLP